MASSALVAKQVKADSGAFREVKLFSLAREAIASVWRWNRRKVKKHRFQRKLMQRLEDTQQSTSAL